MAYGTSDPRSGLTSHVTSDVSNGARKPQYFNFDQVQPAEVSELGSPTWYFRGQNFVISQTRLRSGDSLERVADEHEYVVLLTSAETDVMVSANQDTADIQDVALVAIAPGNSRIHARTDTLVTRLFDARSDVLGYAQNGTSYVQADANVIPLDPWPAPTRAAGLRVYYPERVEAEPGRFGRIYRTSSFMVNFLDPQLGPRDSEKLSPHHHDDFEQCSFVVEGSYVHHIRAPWTPRKSEWWEDQHELVGSPSATIIPPPAVHTSEAVGQGVNRMIDIFCPPRKDFSDMDGWVLNAADYPSRDVTR